MGGKAGGGTRGREEGRPHLWPERVTPDGRAAALPRRVPGRDGRLGRLCSAAARLGCAPPCCSSQRVPARPVPPVERQLQRQVAARRCLDARGAPDRRNGRIVRARPFDDGSEERPQVGQGPASPLRLQAGGGRAPVAETEPRRVAAAIV